jgi:hypothetical protein
MLRMAKLLEELLGFIEYVEAFARGLRLWTGWVETDEVFV